MTELLKERISELNKSNPEQSITYKPYCVERETKILTISRISITQKLFADQGVNILEIFVPDSLNVNSNSTANIKKVLSHIERN